MTIAEAPGAHITRHLVDSTYRLKDSWLGQAHFISTFPTGHPFCPVPWVILACTVLTHCSNHLQPVSPFPECLPVLLPLPPCCLFLSLGPWF